jgi:serpin B
MKTMTTLCILILLATVMSCQKQDSSPEDLKNLPEKSAELINSDNAFGLELFQKIAAKAEKNDNTMISPLSVSLALAMTYNGAVGKTKTEMEKTLKLNGLTTEQINKAYKALVAALQSADADVGLEIADAIYYRQELKVKADFVSVNKEYYDASVSPLNFNSTDALKTINGWVAKKTHDKIPTIIDSIDPDLVMILLNAIYFNGVWKNKFGEKLTHSLPFTFGDGSRKDVAQMNQETALGYTSNDLFSAVNLPYGNGQYQMTILLPSAGKKTKDVISALNNENWITWMKSFNKENNVVLTMPRFKFAWEMKLNDILTNR